MHIRTILLHADSDKRFGKRLAVAAELAGLHEAKLFAVMPKLPPVSVVAYGEYIPTQAIEAQVEAENARAEQLRAQVTEKLSHAGINWEWRAVEGQPEAVIASAGAVADLIVMGQDSEEAESAAVAAVALTAGRPVLCVPFAGEFTSLGKRILLAWNGSRESVRAVHDSLAFLQRADKVILFAAAEDDDRASSVTDAAAHLAAYGAKVEVQMTTLSGIEVGSAILNAAADNSADMIVMGAYGHSRLREWVFGGATRTLLQSMTVPVLLSH